MPFTNDAYFGRYNEILKENNGNSILAWECLEIEIRYATNGYSRFTSFDLFQSAFNEYQAGNLSKNVSLTYRPIWFNV